MKIDGGCHCGFFAYEAEIDVDKVMICHCTDRQTLSGSAFRTVVVTREGTFRLLAGEPKIYVKTGESGGQRAQAFCPECGTPIYSGPVGDAPSIHVLRLGTVRQRDLLVPTVQLWARSAQKWVGDIDAIRSMEKQPAFDSKGGVN